MSHYKFDEGDLFYDGVWTTEQKIDITPPPKYEGIAPQVWQPVLVHDNVVLGFSALVVAIWAMIFSLLILHFSNGDSVDRWTVQPTVYLAVAAAIAATALRFAKNQALPIAWWHSILSGGQIRHLEAQWRAGQTVSGALWYICSVPRISLATLVVVLMVIDAALLQRASSVVPGSHKSNTSLSFSLTPELPYGFSGQQSYRENQWSAQLFQILREVARGNPISLHVQGCDPGAECTATVLGPGVRATGCTSSGPVIVSRESMIKNPSANWSDASEKIPPVQPTGLWRATQPIFEIDLYVSKSSHGSQTVYKDPVLRTAMTNLTETGLSYTSRTCYLVHHVTKYDMRFVQSGTKATVSMKAREFLQRINTTWVTLNASNPWAPSTTSLLYFGFAPLVNAYATATINYKPNHTTHDEWGLDENTVDTEVAKYFSYSQDGNWRWNDPWDSVVTRINELLVHCAISAGTSADLTAYSAVGLPANQTVKAKQTIQQNVFKTNFKWFAGAAVLDLVAIFTVLPLFWGWWRLPRGLTLSPFQMALAFDSPLVKDVPSTAGAEGVIREMGDQKIAYGCLRSYASNDEVPSKGLGIGLTCSVRRPTMGMSFTK